MYYVYVLQSQKDGKRYYGFCKNLDNRIKDHNSGRVKSTKSRTRFKVVYYEVIDSLVDALKKERYFKSGFGRKYINNRIKEAPSSNG